MEKLQYHLHEAINLRELTWFDWIGADKYWHMNPTHANKMISFKESIKQMEKDAWNPYSPPTLVHEVLIGIFNEKGTNYRGVTREEWLKNYRSYREYMNQSTNPMDYAL